MAYLLLCGRRSACSALFGAGSDFYHLRRECSGEFVFLVPRCTIRPGANVLGRARRPLRELCFGCQHRLVARNPRGRLFDRLLAMTSSMTSSSG